MAGHEKLGSFYLGNEHNLASGETLDAKVLYDSRDLTTHAVCVGMTGSGKTGLCLSLLEEALLDGVPAIAIDPKGDLGNLLMVDPNFDPGFYQQWMDPGEATRKGVEPEEYAKQTAEKWQKGLAASGVSTDAIASYASASKVIYTPGSSAGVPLSVLKSFDAPSAELLDDAEALGDRIASTVSGLLTLMGIDADPVQSREHIFLSTLLSTAWRAGRSLSLADLIREMQDPPFEKVGILDLETFFPTTERTKLTLQLNNLLASPTFASWIEGAPLDIQKMLYTEEGKPRLAILSIAHLSDTERMFFVTLLLSEVLAWMRTQPGTSSLRALLYIDEVFGYFPPVGNPPSKTPMLTLLKQARAFGLGCVLATQNPVDLDYKGLSNAGTWFLGRLQTERDKMRVIEGLEGAAAQSSGGFDKAAMEATLAGLGSRVFLLNNVHDSQPKVFHTRWAMSYLRGPLTRSQIKQLMDPIRDALLPQADDDADAGKATASNRPVLPGDVDERFVILDADSRSAKGVEYRPSILATAKLHFERASYDIDRWDEVIRLASIGEEMPDDVWVDSEVRDSLPEFEDQPHARAHFATLPSKLASTRTYKSLSKDLIDHLYRHARLAIWRSDDLDVVSEPDEEELAFRQRIAPQLAAAKSKELEEIEQSFAKKTSAAEERIVKAKAYYDEQNSQFLTRAATVVWKIVELVLAAVGGKATSRRTSSSASGARQAATERGQAQRAKQKLEAAEQELAELHEEQESAKKELNTKYDANTLELQHVELAPKKSEIDVETLALVWIPHASESSADQS